MKLKLPPSPYFVRIRIFNNNQPIADHQLLTSTTLYLHAEGVSAPAPRTVIPIEHIPAAVFPFVIVGDGRIQVNIPDGYEYSRVGEDGQESPNRLAEGFRLNSAVGNTLTLQPNQTFRLTCSLITIMVSTNRECQSFAFRDWWRPLQVAFSTAMIVFFSLIMLGLNAIHPFFDTSNQPGLVPILFETTLSVFPSTRLSSQGTIRCQSTSLYYVEMQPSQYQLYLDKISDSSCLETSSANTSTPEYQPSCLCHLVRKTYFLELCADGYLSVDLCTIKSRTLNAKS
jgi:hypothetical protein